MDTTTTMVVQLKTNKQHDIPTDTCKGPLLENDLHTDTQFPIDYGTAIEVFCTVGLVVKGDKVIGTCSVQLV